MPALVFQSPRSGKFESNKSVLEYPKLIDDRFQSPRSGKFESNAMVAKQNAEFEASFNPLDRGNLNQIRCNGN